MYGRILLIQLYSYMPRTPSESHDLASTVTILPSSLQVELTGVRTVLLQQKVNRGYREYKRIIYLIRYLLKRLLVPH